MILAVHGNNLFSDGWESMSKPKSMLLIRRLLTPITAGKTSSLKAIIFRFMPKLLPNEFLSIIEEDLKTPEPQIYALMKPAGSGIFARLSSNRPALGARKSRLETRTTSPCQLSYSPISPNGRLTDNWVK